MNMVAWNPFRELDAVFARPQGLATNEGQRTARWLPAVDIRETDNDYRIDVELPAVAAKDVDVSLKEGVLTVAGERRDEREENGRVHRVERRYGAFRRSFRLPDDADEGAISAEARDGVLYLVIGKREQDLPRSIEVKVH